MEKIDKKNFEKILDSLHEGIIVHGKDRRIRFFNHSAEKINGFQREEFPKCDYSALTH
jgi:PAS domain S-box-containing protein